MSKTKLFALYWGQEILKYQNSDNDKYWDKQIYPVDGHNIICKHLQLILRSVDMLTDDEKKYLIHLAGWDFNPKIISMEYWVVKITNHDILFLTNDEDDFYKINNLGIDYLRSIGIAIPFTTIENGEIKTYSIQEQINNGWIKIVNK